MIYSEIVDDIPRQIEIGDKVKCIKASAVSDRFGIVGEIYTVFNIRTDSFRLFELDRLCDKSRFEKV